MSSAAVQSNKSGAFDFAATALTPPRNSPGNASLHSESRSVQEAPLVQPNEPAAPDPSLGPSIVESFEKACDALRVRRPSTFVVEQLFSRSFTTVEEQFIEGELIPVEVPATPSSEVDEEEEEDVEASLEGKSNEAAGGEDAVATEDQPSGEAASSTTPKKKRKKKHPNTRTEYRQATQLVEIHHRVPLEPASIVNLDLSRVHLGSRQLVAICRVIQTRLRNLATLNLSNMGLYGADDCPTNLNGNEAVELIVQALQNHNRLVSIDFSNNGFATQAYLWLVQLAKRSPMLREMKIDGNPLEEYQAAHLTALVQRKHRTAPPAKQRGGSAKKVAAETTAAQVGQDAGFRTYKKNPQTRTRLRTLLTASALFRSYQQEACPPPKPKVNNDPYPDLPESMKIGPTLSEIDEERREAARQAAFASDTESMLDCMHRAVFHEGELVTEAGDSAEWVHLLYGGGTLEVHRGDDVMTLRPGAMIGDEELLASEVTVRRTTAVARLASSVADRITLDLDDGATPVVVVYQLRREVFLRYMQRHVSMHRQVWRRVVDKSPSMLGVGPMGRAMFMDLLSEEWEESEGAEVLDPSRYASHLILVTGGVLSVRREDKEVRALERGEVFLLKTNSPMDDLSLKVTAPPLGMAVLPITALRLVPMETQQSILRQARAYEALVQQDKKYQPGQ